MSVLLITGVLALLIGVVLGLLGGGGGILAVPLLVFVIGMPAKSAIAMSLVFVGTTSAFGAALAARDARVRWQAGSLFGAASMIGAFVGGRIAHFVPEGVLLATLAAIMLITAGAMFRGRNERSAGPGRIALARVLAIGVGVGAVSGLVGAGGGFLIVPALTLFGGLAMREAIGTSLFIIALQSFAGFAGHITHVEVDWPVVGIMTGAAIVGMYVGTLAGKRVSATTLKRAFAALVLVTGLLVLARQLPPAATAIVAVVAVIASLFIARKAAHPSHLRTTEPSCVTSLLSQP
jgi:uncharacterized protein